MVRVTETLSMKGLIINAMDPDNKKEEAYALVKEVMRIATATDPKLRVCHLTANLTWTGYQIQHEESRLLARLRSTLPRGPKI